MHEKKMKIKPRIIFIALIIACLATLLLWPIGKQTSNNRQLKIITTIFPAYDFARAVSANTNVDLKLLIKPGVDLHDYDPTPQDIIDVKESDIFIYNGGESEEWVGKILTGIDKNKTTIVRMMDAVVLKEEADSEASEPEYDEHIWTSVKNVIAISKKITDTIIEHRPSDASTINQNYTHFRTSLEALDSNFQKLSATKTGTLIVADRFPFHYFVDDYHFDYAAALPGCSEHTEASPKTITELIQKASQSSPKIIFKLELSDGKIADTIAKATNAKILTWHSAHNISQSDFDAGKTYIDIMRENLTNLSEALHDRA